MWACCTRFQEPGVVVEHLNLMCTEIMTNSGYKRKNLFYKPLVHLGDTVHVRWLTIKNCNDHHVTAAKQVFFKNIVNNVMLGMCLLIHIRIMEVYCLEFKGAKLKITDIFFILKRIGIELCSVCLRYCNE